MEKLGAERAQKIRIVDEDVVVNSFYGQLVLGEGVSSGADEQLAAAASRAGGQPFSQFIWFYMWRVFRYQRVGMQLLKDSLSVTSCSVSNFQSSPF